MINSANLIHPILHDGGPLPILSAYPLTSSAATYPTCPIWQECGYTYENKENNIIINSSARQPQQQLQQHQQQQQQQATIVYQTYSPQQTYFINPSNYLNTFNVLPPSAHCHHHQIPCHYSGHVIPIITAGSPECFATVYPYQQQYMVRQEPTAYMRRNPVDNIEAKSAFTQKVEKLISSSEETDQNQVLSSPSSTPSCSGSCSPSSSNLNIKVVNDSQQVVESRKEKNKKTSVTETFNMKAALNEMENRTGQTLYLNYFCEKYGIQRRVMFDFLTIMNGLKICTRYSNDEFKWNGVKLDQSLLSVIKKGAQKETKPIQFAYNCADKAGLYIVCQNLISLFLYLDTDVLDLRKVAKLFAPSGPSLRTMLRKLYTISSSLETIGFINRTGRPAEIRLAKMFFDLTVNDIAISALLNREDDAKTGEVSYQQRRNEFEMIFH